MGLNLGSETNKSPKENSEKTLQYICIGKDFLDLAPASQMGLHQTKKLLHGKENTGQSEGTTDRERKFPNYISGKEFISRM